MDEMIQRLERRIELIEQKIDGNKDLQYIGLSDKLNQLTNDVQKLESAFDDLLDWRKNVLMYVKIAIIVSALGGFSGLSNIATVLRAMLGGI